MGVLGDRLCGSGITVGCTLRAAEVVYVTEWGAVGATPIHRELLSAVNVPTPLDVDNKVGPDLTATVQILSGKPVLRVSKFATASTPLPVAIVAVSLDPNPNAPDGTRGLFHYGYDARRSTAPTTFTETFSSRTDGIAINASSSGAPSVALLGRRGQIAWQTGQEVGSNEGRVDFTPLPTSIDADLSNSKSGGTDTTNAELTLAQASKIEVGYAQTKTGVDHLDLTGTLDKLESAALPDRSAKVNLVQSAVAGAEPDPKAKRTVVDVQTLGTRVARGELTLASKEWDAGKRDYVLKTTVDASQLEQLPNWTTVTLAPQTATDPQRITVDSHGQAFGLIDVARANGTPARLPDDQYAYVFDDGVRQSTGARIRGLREGTLEIASRPTARAKDFVHVDETSAGGPFTVLVDEPARKRQVKASIQSLPSTVDFTLRPQGTPMIAYRASDQTGLARVAVHDAAGIARSSNGCKTAAAKDLEVIAKQVATDLTVSLSPGAKKITLVATDAKPGQTTPGDPADIGQLDVRLSDGPLTGADQSFVTGLGTTKDGTLLHDRSDRYTLFARVTSLHSATLELDQEPLRINLKHGPQYSGARPFQALVEQQDFVADDIGCTDLDKSIAADVQDLPGEIDLKVRKNATATLPTIDYSGSDVIGKTTVRLHDDSGITKSAKTGVPADDLLVTLTRLPKRVDATLLSAPGGRATIDVNAPGDPIGQVEAQLWTRPSSSTTDLLPHSDDQSFVTGLGSTKDGALVRDVSTRHVIFARLSSLRRAHLELERGLIKIEPLTHGAQYGTASDPARPFHVRADEPNKTTEATIKDLPDITHLRLWEKATATNPNVDYKGSAVIAEVHVRVHENDADGVARSDRTGEVAKDLKLELSNVPAGPVTLRLDPSGKNMDLGASGEIGRVDAQLWTRPAGATDDSLPVQGDQAFVADLAQTGRDGALVRDVADGVGGIDDRYVVFARITSLASAKLVLDQDSPDVIVETGSRRDMKLDIDNNPMPDCQDGKDNDSDGLVDGDDAQCVNRYDDSETSARRSPQLPNEQVTATIKFRPNCMRLVLGKRRIDPSKCSSGLPGGLNLPNPSTGAQTILFEGGDKLGGPQTTGLIDATIKGQRDLDGQQLSTRLEGVVPRLEAVIQGKDTIDLGTLGGRHVDLVEFALQKGAVRSGDTISSQFDGLLVRNKLLATGLLDRSVVFARLSKLRSLHFARQAAGRTLDVNVDAVGHRTFDLRVDVDSPKSTGQGLEILNASVRGAIDPLRPNTNLTMDDFAGGETKVHYEAASSSSTLLFGKTQLDGQGFKTESLEIEAEPLPSRVDFCYRGGGAACAGLLDVRRNGVLQPDAFTGDVITDRNGPCAGLPAGDTRVCVKTNGPHPTGPTVVFDASQQTEVTFKQCLINFCENANRPRLEVEVAAQLFRLQLSSMVAREPVHDKDGKFVGFNEPKLTLVFVDTDNKTLNELQPKCLRPGGEGCALYLKMPGGSELDELKLTLPNSAPFLTADDRRVRIRQNAVGVPIHDDSFPNSSAGGPPSLNVSGSVFCPSAMKLGVNGGLFGIGGADIKPNICVAKANSP